MGIPDVNLVYTCSIKRCELTSGDLVSVAKLSMTADPDASQFYYSILLCVWRLENPKRDSDLV